MDRYQKVFGRTQGVVIGMHHVGALPGTPKYHNGTSLRTIVDAAVKEAVIYAKAGVVRRLIRFQRLSRLPRMVTKAKIR
jgi:predicted TIM-barrel enzyme